MLNLARRLCLASCCGLMLALPTAASAHFGMVIPSENIVFEKKDAQIGLTLAFAHPMEMVGMDLARPEAVQVVVNGKTTDLLPALKPCKFLDREAWQAEYTLARPGVHQVVMQPAPYWEPAEDCFIVHYTKTYLAAFGDEDGWDQPLGLRTEIVPLTRPFGNYAGNVFQGQVLLDGKPVAGCDVEVEFYNRDRAYETPNDYMVTQVVKTDPNGIFTYAVPFAGWWGFAALNTAGEKMDHEGTPKDVELGAVLWTNFLDPVKK